MSCKGRSAEGKKDEVSESGSLSLAFLYVLYYNAQEREKEWTVQRRML